MEPTSFYISHHIVDTEGKIYSDFFWQKHIPNDLLWLICEELNIVQPAGFSLWDHEQLLAHNYVVIHYYLEEETGTDSEDFLFISYNRALHLLGYSDVKTPRYIRAIVMVKYLIHVPSFSLGHLLPEGGRVFDID